MLVNGCENELIETVYLDLANQFTDNNYMVSRAILCSLNNNVDKFNKIITESFPGK